MSKGVLFASANGIATITLNRPAALNALDADMVAHLTEAVYAASHDDARVVVIRGAGGYFLTGGDIQGFEAQLDAEPDKAIIKRKLEAFIQLVHEMIVAMRTMPKPIVTTVRGAYAGFGVSLASACGLGMAVDDAFFTLDDCPMGVSPGGGWTYALPRAVSLKRAFEIAPLRDRFDASTAQEAGLINRVVAAAHFETAASALAERLARGPTRSGANTKPVLNTSLEVNLPDQLNAEAKSFADCAATDHFAEGVTAFVEKRPPRFSGT